MSDPKTAMSKKPDQPETTMTDENVLAYLKANPKFLQQNPSACDYLIPPKPAHGKGVSDFQSFMINRLKADKEAVLETTRTIVENSRANLNNQLRIHNAILLLLEASSFEDFIHTVTLDLATMLDVDIAALVVETNGQSIPHITTTGIRIVPQGTVDKWMGGKQALLQDNIIGIDAIYGGGATLVHSQILLRIDISMDTPPAILAFGSRDPEAFHDGQATDQILFLTRVIERCLRIWLHLAN